jgi:alpha-glucoside transport system substrate-binding protein
MRTVSLLLVVLMNLSACAGPGSAGTVTILASWSGSEEASFRKVLAAFEAEENIKVNYVGTRALGQVLQSEVQKGTPPDIAVMPSPSELATFARRGYLKRLDDVVGQQDGEYSQQWLQFEKVAQQDRYGVAVKADLKSMIWFSPQHQPQSKPQTGDELTAPGAQWCMGMGATPDSGWPGTDWIEDILLHQSGPEVYQQWAAGKLKWTSEPVRRAWTTWGKLKVPANKQSVLLTDFGDAGQPLFTGPGCKLDHAASFTMGSYQGYDGKPVPGKDKGFDFFPFPTFGDVPRAWEVSADLAGMFNDTPQARKLIKFLASPRAQSIWPEAGGAFSVNRKVDRTVYRDDVSRRIADTLTSKEILCFDASDLMPATIRTTFYRAVLEYLNNPSQLDELLRKLEMVRANIKPGDWLDFPCGT